MPELHIINGEREEIRLQDKVVLLHKRKIHEKENCGERRVNKDHANLHVRF